MAPKILPPRHIGWPVAGMLSPGRVPDPARRGCSGGPCCLPVSDAGKPGGHPQPAGFSILNNGCYQAGPVKNASESSGASPRPVSVYDLILVATVRV